MLASSGKVRRQVVISTLTSHNGVMNDYDDDYDDYKTDQEIVDTERCWCSGNQECHYCLALIRLTEGDE